MLRSPFFSFAVLASLLASMWGCGGAAENAPPVEGAPLTAEERTFFEDGIDFVADPEALDGQWRDNWSRELDQRVRRSDIVARVTVQTLRIDTDLNRRVTYRLFVEAEQEYVGDLPDELVLRSSEGDTGYGTLEGNEDRILDHSFVLFLKWELPEGADAVEPRWHLSPAVDPVVARTEYLLERRRGYQRSEGQRTITIHEH